jgi:hypothetical protein
MGIHVEQSGSRKLILRQPSNGLGVNVKKGCSLFRLVTMQPWVALRSFFKNIFWLKVHLYIKFYRRKWIPMKIENFQKKSRVEFHSLLIAEVKFLMASNGSQ